MPDISPNRDPWQLTEDGLNALLSALHPDRDEAARRYERLRDRLAFFFSRRQFVQAEALADEVFDRIARRLHTGEHIASMESYAYGVARFVAREQSRLLIRAEEAGSEYARNVSSSSDTTDEDILERLLGDCLANCSSQDRELLTQYYLYRGRQRIEHRQKLAASLQITAAMLRQRMFRLRSAIEDCVRAKLGAAAAARKVNR